MKQVFFFLMLVFTIPSFAAWNEVECTGIVNNNRVQLDVEQAFPQGSYFKRATLTVDNNGGQETHDYTVTTRATMGFNRVEYSAPGLRLEVDFWPDQRPQWGRTYRGNLLSSVLGNRTQRVECRFPNIW